MFIWQFATTLPRLTLLNFPTALAPAGNSCTQVAADGRYLPFKDHSFDIVFSNSVIEHVGNSDNQAQFAAEISRVGCGYWVQTPNRWFPVEMHVMLPMIHFLPVSIQRRIAYRFTGWEKLTHPSAAQRAFYLEHFLTGLNLLDRASLSRLFPDGNILNERLLGWPKSLIAFRT